MQPQSKNETILRCLVTRAQSTFITCTALEDSKAAMLAAIQARLISQGHFSSMSSAPGKSLLA